MAVNLAQIRKYKTLLYVFDKYEKLNNIYFENNKITETFIILSKVRQIMEQNLPYEFRDPE